MSNLLVTELGEKQLDELLAYTPGFTAKNLDNIKTQCLQKAAKKRKTGKRLLLLAIAAAVAFALSGVALAAYTGFDFGSFYNSLFNNPNVGERLEVGRTATSNGLEITLLSAVVDRHQAFLTIEIIDTEGSRLSDSISVVKENYADGIHAILTGPVIYSEAENKATIALTVLYNDNIAEKGAARLSIDAITTSIMRIGNKPLGFDIAANATDKESIPLQDWHDLLGGGGGYSTSVGYNRDAKGGTPTEIGEPEPRPIMPGGKNVVIDGFEWAVVSNAGVADGFLHIQIKFLYENERDMLSNKNIDKALFCIIDGEGNATGICYQANNSGYLDMMFEIGEETDLADLTLALWGDRLVTDTVIQGPWNVDFEVGQALDQRVLVAYPDEDPVFSKFEVTCSPVRFVVRMTANGVYTDENGYTQREGYEKDANYDRADAESLLAIQRELINELMGYFNSFETPYLTLEDGSMVALEPMENLFDMHGGEAWCRTDYYDIEAIRSVTLCGREYSFTGPR